MEGTIRYRGKRRLVKKGRERARKRKGRADLVLVLKEIGALRMEMKDIREGQKRMKDTARQSIGVYQRVGLIWEELKKSDDNWER